MLKPLRLKTQLKKLWLMLRLELKFPSTLRLRGSSIGYWGCRRSSLRCRGCWSHSGLRGSSFISHYSIGYWVTVPLEVVSGTEKKRRNWKKKSSALTVPYATDAPPVEVEWKTVDEESSLAKLTKKQKLNILTNTKRSAARRALHQTLGPHVHNHIPPRHLGAIEDPAAKELAANVFPASDAALA